MEVRAATQEELSRHAAEKELREVEKEWDAAVTNRDAPILTRLMANDFVYLSDFGSGANENKTQRLALFVQLKKDDAKDGIERHNVVDTTVRVFGDTAVATAKTTNSTRAGRKWTSWPIHPRMAEARRQMAGNRGSLLCHGSHTGAAHRGHHRRVALFTLHRRVPVHGWRGVHGFAKPRGAGRLAKTGAGAVDNPVSAGVSIRVLFER